MRRLLQIPETTTTLDDQWLPIQRVQLDPHARKALTERLSAVGSWQGGSLFGRYAGHTLQVPLAFGLAMPGWNGHPLLPSLPFLIGVTEATEAVLDPEVDWVGQWVAAPDGRLPDLRDDLRLLTLGARQGLFTNRCPLLIVGLQEGYLHGRAYIWDEGMPVSVDCPSDLPTGMA